MDIIKLKLNNHSMLQLVECEPYIAQEIYDTFSFYVPGYKFMPAFKRKVWDGQIHMLNKMNGEINAGLLHHIKRFAMDKGYGVVVEESAYGIPGQKNKINHMEQLTFMSSLKLPFVPRDYQYDAVSHAIENKRCVLVSPTGSGKSLIIYMLFRWYINTHPDKVLIVVPTTGLVEQMFKDFGEYGFDSTENCHVIYSGKDKETDKKIVISTWQSIHKLHPKWFEQFGMVIGDECHGFKAKSLSSIMNKAINAEYRYGTTGTLDGTETNRMVLEGLFGPVKKVTTTAELQEKKQLASLSIDVIHLDYSKEEKETIVDATYQQEIDFIVSHASRNRFISRLCIDLQGNTLVLFNLVDKHGKVLYDIISKIIPENRKLFYVSGETKTENREEIRNIIERETDSITLASLGTFSTGINIRNIHNIVFASPSKSQVRVLQSIGRGLRVSDDKRETKLYDIADDLRTSAKPNFTLKHSAERIRIYTSERFPYKITKVRI